MSKIPLGIMQGRLSPRSNGRYQSFPFGTWTQEFFIAKALGLSCIEFIFDYENCECNPLTTEEGLNWIRRLVDLTSVQVRSICADYFMKYRLFERDDRVRRENAGVLEGLIRGASSIGIRDITVPCVDSSSLKEASDFEGLKKTLSEVLDVARTKNVNINLETDLPPKQFLSLIEEMDHPNLKINYDTGNSASLGYRPEEELASYGKYVSVLHIKDRVLGGGSVKLGTGSVDFDAVFRWLDRTKFNGVMILQAARADDYVKELEFVAEQLQFTRQLINKYL